MLDSRNGAEPKRARYLVAYWRYSPSDTLANQAPFSVALPAIAPSAFHNSVPSTRAPAPAPLAGTKQLDGLLPVHVDANGGRIILSLPAPDAEGISGRFLYATTLRTGIEKSRNLMTVRLANDMGMKIVAEYAERFGIYDKMPPLLSMSLGSGETTVMRMVSAYSVIANGGKLMRPHIVKSIKDQDGNEIQRIAVIPQPGLPNVCKYQRSVVGQ